MGKITACPINEFIIFYKIKDGTWLELGPKLKRFGRNKFENEGITVFVIGDDAAFEAYQVKCLELPFFTPNFDEYFRKRFKGYLNRHYSDMNWKNSEYVIGKIMAEQAWVKMFSHYKSLSLGETVNV